MTERRETDSVVSTDGTPIGYRKLGAGPGVVVLHGAFESAQSHEQLAEALADSFAIYLPDRRGRGLSGPHGVAYCIQREVEDLAALLTKTGARHVVGVSSGAIICLHAALSLPGIQRAVIFEPPLAPAGPGEAAMLARFEREISEGALPQALVTAMKVSQMGPRLFNVLPRWLLERLTAAMLAGEERQASPGDVTVRMLAPTLRYDFQLAVEGRRSLQSLEAIRAEVVLLGGSKSPTYLKVALDDLQKRLPKAKRMELKGIGHGALGNSNRGGQPALAASVLRQVLA